MCVIGSPAEPVGKTTLDFLKLRFYRGVEIPSLRFDDEPAGLQGRIGRYLETRGDAGPLEERPDLGNKVRMDANEADLFRLNFLERRFDNSLHGFGIDSQLSSKDTSCDRNCENHDVGFRFAPYLRAQPGHVGTRPQETIHDRLKFRGCCIESSLLSFLVRSVSGLTNLGFECPLQLGDAAMQLVRLGGCLRDGRRLTLRIVEARVRLRSVQSSPR